MKRKNALERDCHESKGLALATVIEEARDRRKKRSQ